ncbi:SAM-dependent methyltransferase [Puteibacter caeruleilacunae]|nr:SAM-dependent methyltransferase [Puteibacter caeruleilacunae]
MKRILQQTEDGSHTLHIPEMDETYHSIHGAIQESNHVFIEAGLKKVTIPVVHIFEVGFGTGLNALLTCLEALKNNTRIYYHTIELYPLDEELWRNLNYPDQLSDQAQDIFNKLHEAPWEEEVQITDGFIILKTKNSLVDYKFTGELKYDLIYFDAFAPGKQEEMWSKEIFQNITEVMNAKSVFVTYCAKGAVRRNLQEAGLTMERIPGPPGKRQMLRGTKE